MNTCWKCGASLAEGKVECEDGCGTRATITDAQIKEAMRRQDALTASIDWEKIKTVEDVRVFLRACYGERIYFPFGIPDSIKPFRKEGGSQP